MDLQLKGKTALVTGSTKGIGRAIGAALAAEGVKVVLNGRTAESIAEAANAIRAQIPDAELDGFAADLSNADEVAALVQEIPSVDILVNSLGIFEPKEFADISDDDWRRFFDVNVLSGVRLCRAYLPGMKQRDWGRIVFISSESAIQIPVEMIHYGMTKTAQIAVARGLAETCAGTGVTVNSVLPGPTLSAGVQDFVSKLSDGQTFEEFQAEYFAKMRPSSLLQRFATPQEVASMVAYVCSPLASATNGAALRVDGGVIRAAV